MAQRPRKPDPGALDLEEPRGDLQSLLDNMKENPLLYGVSVAFIVLCGLAGVVYRVHSLQEDREVAAEYARALKTEDHAERARALEKLVGGKSRFADEILYMHGEMAFKADDRVAAAAAFQRLRDDYPESPFLSDAVEGLGYVEEDRDDYEAALANYQEVLDKWPDTFAARRQPFNIGRCQERAGNLAEAITAFRDQLDLFPGSSVARKAQARLDSLRNSHPGLFPEDALASVIDDLEEAVTETTDTLPDIQIDVDEEPPAQTVEDEPAEKTPDTPPTGENTEP